MPNRKDKKSAHKVGFPPIPERAPKSVQSRIFCTFCAESALLGVLSGIRKKPTFCADFLFFCDLGSVARTGIHKRRPQNTGWPQFSSVRLQFSMGLLEHFKRLLPTASPGQGFLGNEIQGPFRGRQKTLRIFSGYFF